ncbi:MAG: FAD-dependent monooxygenase [Saprospiraceae bacterium]
MRKKGIDSIVPKHRSREYLEARVRAGLLEQNIVDVMKYLGLADRLMKESQEHHGVYFIFKNDRIRVPFDNYTDSRHITIYVQQEVIKDLLMHGLMILELFSLKPRFIK